MYIKESANMLHNISTGDSPTALQELFKKPHLRFIIIIQEQRRKYTYITYSCLELQKCSFFQLGAEIWNSIDQSLHSKSKKIFKYKMCSSVARVLVWGGGDTNAEGLRHFRQVPVNFEI
jgi:hypothetical protein